MKKGILAGGVILLFPLFLFPWGILLPPPHTHCVAERGQQPPPHQHRAVIRPDGSLAWYNIYGDHMQRILPSPTGQVFPSYVLSPSGAWHDLGKTAPSSDPWILPTRSSPFYLISQRITGEDAACRATGYRVALDHPPQLFLG